MSITSSKSDEILIIDLRHVLSLLNRRRRTIITSALIVAVLVAIYCVISPLIGGSYYTATTQLLIDPQRAQIFRQNNQDNAVVADLTFDNATIESQTAVILSDTVIEAVVRKLDLLHDPQFMENPYSPMTWIKAVTGPIQKILGMASQQPTEEQRISAVADAIQTKLVKVDRVGLSYAIEIDMSAWTAARAAQIANAIADAYIQDQINSKIDTAQRAETWLQSRVDRVRQQATEADRAVVDFKLANNLVDVGGTLVDEQQLADVSSQLSVARSATGEAKAKLDRIMQIQQSRDPSAANVSDAIGNDVIKRLRDQYVDAARQQSDLASRYGPNHVAVIKLRNSMTEIQKQIESEEARIAQAYQSDYAIAKQHEDSLQTQLSGLFVNSSKSRNLSVKLKDLEAASLSYRNLYATLLQRANLATQQVSFPIADARVISAATPPLQKSWPKTGLFTALGLVVGAMIGCGIAALQEYMDRAVRTTRQAELLTGVRCLGALPMSDGHRDRRQPVGRRTKVAGLPEHRVMRVDNPLLTYAIDRSLSGFAETIRSVKVALQVQELRSPIRTIGVVSAVGGEGKSTVSANLARSFAQTGKRVLLVDADMRHPSLTGDLAPNATVGLGEVLDGSVPISEALWFDAATTLHFLPCASNADPRATAEMLSSGALKALLDQLSRVYDLIVFDFPPLAPVADVHAASPMIDRFLMVVEWGKTPSELIERCLAADPGITDKLLGVLLNKVDITSLERLEVAPSTVGYSDAIYQQG